MTEPTELFLMPGLKPALESLERQLEISSNYLDHILIRGPRGSGKSYFVQIIKEHFGHFQEILDCDCENIPHSELTKWLQYDLNENRIIILDHLESVKKDEYQYLNGLMEKARIVAIFRDGDNSIVPEALEMFKITIDIPPLFEHRADILYFIAKKWSDRGISSENLMSLCAYRWPGNLRELDRALQQLFSTHCLPDELTRVSEFHYIFNSLLESGLNFSELVLAIDKCFSYVVPVFDGLFVSRGLELRPATILKLKCIGNNCNDFELRVVQVFPTDLGLSDIVLKATEVQLVLKSFFQLFFGEGAMLHNGNLFDSEPFKKNSSVVIGFYQKVVKEWEIGSSCPQIRNLLSTLSPSFDNSYCPLPHFSEQLTRKELLAIKMFVIACRRLCAQNIQNKYVSKPDNSHTETSGNLNKTIDDVIPLPQSEEDQFEKQSAPSQQESLAETSNIVVEGEYITGRIDLCAAFGLKGNSFNAVVKRVKNAGMEFERETPGDKNSSPKLKASNIIIIKNRWKKRSPN